MPSLISLSFLLPFCTNCQIQLQIDFGYFWIPPPPTPISLFSNDSTDLTKVQITLKTCINNPSFTVLWRLVLARCGGASYRKRSKLRSVRCFLPDIGLEAADCPWVRTWRGGFDEQCDRFSRYVVMMEICSPGGMCITTHPWTPWLLANPKTEHFTHFGPNIHLALWKVHCSVVISIVISKNKGNKDG